MERLKQLKQRETSHGNTDGVDFPGKAIPHQPGERIVMSIVEGGWSLAGSHAVRKLSKERSEDEAFRLMLEMADYVRHADEDGAYGAFVRLMDLSKGCGTGLALKIRLFS